MMMIEEANERIVEAEERERLLAMALTAVLAERTNGEGGAGIIIGDGENHVMFFTDGNELRMQSVDKDDPMLQLGMFNVAQKIHSIN